MTYKLNLAEPIPTSHVILLYAAQQPRLEMAAESLLPLFHNKPSQLMVDGMEKYSDSDDVLAELLGESGVS